jgi:RimJ/RimL family protein N-acetyltransferase
MKSTDLTDFHIYRCNPEVTKYQGFNVMNREQAKRFINKQMEKEFGKAGEWAQYGIELKQSGKLIGDCAIKLDQHDSRIAEIGITISHLEQRKGYAKEALSGIVRFLFDIKKLHRIVEIVDAENIASINLLESIGFRKEGHFIENIFFKGKWGSEIQYAILNREWNKKDIE